MSHLRVQSYTLFLKYTNFYVKILKKFTFSRLLRKQIKRQDTDYMHNYSPVAHSTHMMVILTQILRTVSQTRIQPGRSCRRPSCPRIQRRNYSVWHIRKLPVSRDIPHHILSRKYRCLRDPKVWNNQSANKNRLAVQIYTQISNLPPPIIKRVNNGVFHHRRRTLGGKGH